MLGISVSGALGSRVSGVLVPFWGSFCTGVSTAIDIRKLAGGWQANTGVKADRRLTDMGVKGDCWLANRGVEAGRRIAYL